MKILKEAFSGSMPGWVRDNLLNGNYYKRLASDYDLHNAEFHEEDIPISNRDKRLKDPNRINFFLLNLSGNIPNKPRGVKYTEYPRESDYEGGHRSDEYKKSE